MKFEAVLMGLLQGLTEFLPVSSSGHLGLAKVLFGMNEPTLAYDLTLHLATLFAVFIYFRWDICHLLFEWCYAFPNKSARKWPGWRFGWAVIVGTLITGPIGILLKSVSESASVNPLWLGCGFFVTSGLLFSTRFLPVGRKEVHTAHGFVVGLVQGIAVMPGISRSGSTIWAGLISGLSRDEAFRFSFLLSIPAILGAVLIEGRDLGGASAFFHALPDGWFWGALVAFVSGMASLGLLRRLVTSDKFWAFAVYCLLLGCVSLTLSFMGA